MGILDKFKKKVGKDEIKKDEKKKIDNKKPIKEKKVKTAISIKKDRNKKITGNAYRVLVKPLITEKITDLGVFNKYGFVVANNANKIEIKKAIKEVYGVKPIAVNMINMKGKKVRSGRVSGKKKDWRKAIITLKKGEKIEIYQGV